MALSRREELYAELSALDPRRPATTRAAIAALRAVHFKDDDIQYELGLTPDDVTRLINEELFAPPFVVKAMIHALSNDAKQHREDIGRRIMDYVPPPHYTPKFVVLRKPLPPGADRPTLWTKNDLIAHRKKFAFFDYIIDEFGAMDKQNPKTISGLITRLIEVGFDRRTLADLLMTSNLQLDRWSHAETAPPQPKLRALLVEDTISYLLDYPLDALPPGFNVEARPAHLKQVQDTKLES